MTFTWCHTRLHTHWRFLSHWSGHVKSKLLFYYKAADFALKVPHLHWNDRCFLKTSQEELQYKLYVTKCHSSEVVFFVIFTIHLWTYSYCWKPFKFIIFILYPTHISDCILVYIKRFSWSSSCIFLWISVHSH